MAQDIFVARNLSLRDIQRFVADVGPGSFTGVKVGLAMVKSWGYARQVPVAGVSAFDLVDPESPVALPSRRGESYLRVPGQTPTVVATADLPHGTIVGIAPDAATVGASLSSLVWVEAALLSGNYVSEPSISQAKRPVIMGDPHAAE